MQLKDLIDENGHCEIPEGTAEIPVYAFSGCDALKSVHIPAMHKYRWLKLWC